MEVEADELLTKQMSRKAFEEVAEADRDGSFYAQRVLEHRLTETAELPGVTDLWLMDAIDHRRSGMSR